MSGVGQIHDGMLIVMDDGQGCGKALVNGKVVNVELHDGKWVDVSEIVAILSSCDRATLIDRISKNLDQIFSQEHDVDPVQ